MNPPSSPFAAKLAAALSLGGALLFLLQPAACRTALRDSVTLCLNSLLPALFPYFVVCGLLVQTGPLSLFFPLGAALRRMGFAEWRRAGQLLGLGLLGGYAAFGQSLRRASLSPRDSERLLLLGTVSSPGFVVGAVGSTLLGSFSWGVALYLLQLAGNLVCFVFWTQCVDRLLRRKACVPPPLVEENVPADLPGSLSLSAALTDATGACLAVCACVSFFRILLACLPLPDAWTPFAAACLEICTGCACAARSLQPVFACGACLAVLGASVFMQLRTLLPPAVSLWPLLLTRPLQLAVIWGGITLLARLFPAELAVFATVNGRVIVPLRTSPDALFFLLAALCLLAKRCSRARAL